jgi:hypothetical protein
VESHHNVNSKIRGAAAKGWGRRRHSRSLRAVVLDVGYQEEGQG